MSSSILNWINYFEATLLICCKTSSWEYQASSRPLIPSYSEYENAVIEHLNGLKKARQDEYQENRKERENIELAVKDIIDKIRNSDEEYIKILGESYEELKRLSLIS